MNRKNSGSTAKVSPLRPTGNAGLTPTDQQTRLTIDVADTTITDVWQALLNLDDIRDALIRNIRALGTDVSVPELYDALEEREVPIWLQSWIRDIARGDRDAAWHVVKTALKIGTDVGSIADLLAVAGLFDASDADAATPTVSIVVGAKFRERRRDQREAILELVAILAEGLDVRLVTTHLTRRWLAETHRADLPGVSEWCNDSRDGDSVETLVEDAFDTLDPDGTTVEILRLIDDDPAQTMAYSELYNQPELPSDSAIRQHIGTLGDLELAEPFGPDTGRKIELKRAGSAYLDAVAESIGTQQTLSEAVSEPPKSQEQAVLSKQGREGGDPSRPYRTAFLDRTNHATAAAIGTASDVVLADDDLSSATTEADRVRYVSFDEPRGEVVIAVRATGGLQHMVSSAVALASPQLLHQVLTKERVAAVDHPPAILRDARCIGALSEEALSDVETLREEFIEWGEEIEEMTTDLNRGEYDDRRQFRGDIFRTAHGLAGSIAHLFDVLGLDLTREIRVPRGLMPRQRQALVKSIGVAISIQSTYKDFATYRQLFEKRRDRREAAFTPDVDAADPTGSLIGSFVLRGPDLHRLRPHLGEAISSPRELHEDAPEFEVPVTIATPGRQATADIVARVFSWKRLRPTRQAVSALDAIVSSPYMVARAANQLGEESMTRELRPRDLRYMLSVLSPSNLLADLPATVGKILSVLCQTEGKLSQTEVAEAAEVSTQSVRNHRDALAGLGLVVVTPGNPVTYRLSLLEDTNSEDGSTGESVDIHQASEAVSDVAASVCSPQEYGDPDGVIYSALRHPPDPWQLLEEQKLEPWVRVISRLVDADLPTDIDEPKAAIVKFGPTPAQTPIIDTAVAVTE